MNKYWKWIKSHFWIRRAHKHRSYIPPRDVTIVVAGNYKQFGDWCLRNKLHPSSPHVRYVGPVGDTHCRLAGQGPSIKKIVYTGTWRDRRDIGQIMVELDRMLHMYSQVTDREDST